MANYFYTDANGQKQGPINDQLLQSLAAQGVIKPQTLLETESGHKGLAGQISGLKFAASTAPFNPFSTAATVKKLNFYFASYWICAVVGLSLYPIVIGLPILLVGIVFQFILLYQLWKLIPTDIARTTPGKAVGYCFIPFFNFFWIFVAYRGLGKDMNETLARRGIAYRVSFGLTYCILLCVGTPLAITMIDLGLTSLVAFIVLIFFLKSAKNGAIRLLEQGDQ